MKFSQSTFSKLGGLKAWIIVLCGALFYCYQFVIRVSPNVFHENILTSLNINEATFGFLIGLYYWGYSSMQVPLGIAMDRLGPRRIITTAILICSIGCYLFSFSYSILLSYLARFLMGVGAAAGLMGSLKLGTLWLTPQKMGIVTAITMAFGTLGATIGGTPLKILSNFIGWQKVYKLFFLIGILLTVICYLIIRDKPKGSKYQESKFVKTNFQSILSGLFKVFINYQSWLISLFGAFMYIPITVIGIAWGVPLLKKIYSINDIVAAPIASSMFLGAALGSPFFALLSDYLKSRKIPMLFGNIFCFIIWIVIINFKINLFCMYILFFLGGFFYTTKVLTFASNCELHPIKYSAITVGFTNMIVMSIAALSHPIVGILIKFKTSNNILKLSDLRFALNIVPICLIVSLFILFFIKDTYKKN